MRRVVDVMMIAYLHLHFDLRLKMGVQNLALMIPKLIVVVWKTLMGSVMKGVESRMR